MFKCIHQTLRYVNQKKTSVSFYKFYQDFLAGRRVKFIGHLLRQQTETKLDGEERMLNQTSYADLMGAVSDGRES